MNKQGFTLIELLVAIALIALVATIIIPNFRRAQPGYERKVFIAKFNALLNYARQHAITTYQVHQVFIDFKNKKISLRVPAEKKNNKGELVYENVRGVAINPTMAIPSAIEVKQCIIEGYDELSRYVGRKTNETWFFVVPEGITQEVTINFVDTSDRLYGDKPRPIGLVLNPFTAQFKEYDAFQK